MKQDRLIEAFISDAVVYRDEMEISWDCLKIKTKPIGNCMLWHLDYKNDSLSITTMDDDEIDEADYVYCWYVNASVDLGM